MSNIGRVAMAGLATVASLAMAAPAAAVPANFQAKADAYLKSVYGPDAPGAAVIVVEDGKTVYTGAQGAADIAAGRKITADTVFRLGSITKQFTAAVILQLVQEGKLALTDPLAKFLPDYPMPGGQATVTQLLNHTSGIQSYTGIPGFMEEANTARAFTTEQLISEFKDKPDNFERGLGGQQPAVLKPIGPAEFLIDGVDARVSFSGEGEAASGLQLTQGEQEITAERVAS